jgi:transaldolase
MTDDTSRDPLAELSAEGVAVWLDDLSRELLASGALQSLITDRHVVGVTTNPHDLRLGSGQRSALRRPAA